MFILLHVYNILHYHSETRANYICIYMCLLISRHWLVIGGRGATEDDGLSAVAHLLAVFTGLARARVLGPLLGLQISHLDQPDTHTHIRPHSG